MHLVEKHIVECRPLLGALRLSLNSGLCACGDQRRWVATRDLGSLDGLSSEVLERLRCFCPDGRSGLLARQRRDSGAGSQSVRIEHITEV